MIDMEMDNFLYAFNKLNYKSIHWRENNITQDRLFVSKFKSAIKDYNSNCFASFVGRTKCYINYMSKETGFISLFKVFFLKNQDGFIVAKRKHQRLSKKSRMILNNLSSKKGEK